MNRAKASALKLIPQPKRVEPHEGVLALGTLVCVVPETAVLAADADVLAEELGQRLAPGVRACSPEEVPADAAVITLALVEAVEGAPANAFQAYAVDIDSHGIRITGVDADGVFHGTRTLLQIIDNFDHPESIPTLSIRDWPDLRYRGIGHDLRNQIMRIDRLKTFIRRIAYFKYNQLYLYIEIMFDYPSHGDIAPDCALEGDQAAELVEFARRYHVDIVPIQQSLGHQSNLLRLPAYTHLGEVKEKMEGVKMPLWTLSPAYEGTYELLKDMYDDLAAVFPSKFLHAGCDEAYTLGKGASKELADEIGVPGVFVKHIERLRELLPPGRRLGVWGDMLLGFADEVEGKMPSDVIIYDWHYTPQDDGYPSVEWFTSQGLDVIACPAVVRVLWEFTDTHMVMQTIELFLDAARRHGAIGAFMCNWEYPNHGFLDYGWYGFAYGADAAWSGDSSLREVDVLDTRIARLLFRSDRGELAAVFRTLGEPNGILRHEWPSAHWLNTWKFFWEDPQTQNYANEMNDISLRVRGYRIFTRDRLNSIGCRILACADRAERAIDRWGPTAGANGDVLEVVRYAARRWRFFAHRLLYMQSARDAYEYALAMPGKPDAVRAALADASAAADALACELGELDATITRLWRARMQPAGLARYNDIYRHNRNIYARIVEALEAAREQYDTDGTLPSAADVGLEQVVPIEGKPRADGG